MRGEGELILFADDEQAIRELVSAELTSSGYRVVLAANGEEAIALYRQHQKEVRLFITDNVMPAMNGSSAIQVLRKLAPSLPVIFASSESGTESDKPVGAILLHKPFALEELLVAIKRSLK